MLDQGALYTLFEGARTAYSWTDRTMSCAGYSTS